MGDEEQVLTECEEVATEEEKLEIETKLQKVDEDKVVPEDALVLGEDQVTTLLTELRTGKRFFEVMDIGRLYIRTPTVREQQEADWEATKTLTKALKDGLPTPEEMEEILASRGLFKNLQAQTEEFTRRLAKLTAELADVDKKEDKKSKRKALDIAKETADIREKLTSLRVEKEEYMSNTSQGKAQEVRTSYMISRCVFKADTDERYWETYDDYLEETNSQLISTALFNFITFSAGISADFIREFPEARVLRENLS